MKIVYYSYLEGQARVKARGAHIYPSLDIRPCGRDLFAFSGAKKSKSLEKSRAARARDERGLQNHDFDYCRERDDKAKNEDPAKMTYSIPDFWGRVPIYSHI